MGWFVRFFLVMTCAGLARGEDAPPPCLHWPPVYLPEERCPQELRPLFDHFDKALAPAWARLKANRNQATIQEFLSVFDVQWEELKERKQQVLAAKRMGGEAGAALVKLFIATTARQAAGELTDAAARDRRDAAWAVFARQSGLVKLTVDTSEVAERVVWAPKGSVEWRATREGFVWLVPGCYAIKACVAGREAKDEVAVGGEPARVLLVLPTPPVASANTSLAPTNGP